MHGPIDDDEGTDRVPRWIEIAVIAILCGFVGAMLFSIVGRHL